MGKQIRSLAEFEATKGGDQEVSPKGKAEEKKAAVPKKNMPPQNWRPNGVTAMPAATGTSAAQDTTSIKAKQPAASDSLCVFAFRLTPDERGSIHRAAGPGKAAKFARAILVAAARKDKDAVESIINGLNSIG